MTNLVLQVQNLSVMFPSQARRAVDGVSFALDRGQTLGLVGESGSGKSVTALALLGLLPAAAQVQGEVWFYPQSRGPVNLGQLTPRERRHLRGSHLGMIFQDPLSSLNPVYTCGFQLVEAIRQHRRIPRAAAWDRALELLGAVNLAGPELARTLLQRYPHQLSGGQIQRLMIAMAISCQPELLIADEPTTALDVTVQAGIVQLLSRLQQQQNMALIFITHDLGLIADLADWIAVMYQGSIVEAGPVGEVFRDPQHPYTQGLLACRPQPQRQMLYLPTVADFLGVTKDSRGGIHIQAKAISPEQQQVDPDLAHRRLQQLTQQPPLLQVQDLQVRLGHHLVLDQVSFTLFPGETLGLVGESGCGKTTLARTILGLVQPAGGRVWFAGQDLGQPRAREASRQHIQVVFQDPFASLDPRQTVGAAIREPLVIRQGPRPQQWERVAELLTQVGLQPDHRDRYPHEFSGGQRQRVCIARALALNPQLIICDESVSSLDVSVQAQILNLLKRLQQQFHCAYIFISHNLAVVKFMSDRIMVMYAGKIVEVGPAEAVYHHPQQAYTRSLIAAIPGQKLPQGT